MNHNLIYTSKRSFLFGRRLLNKPMNRQSNFIHNYDPNDYLIAMKKFQVKTRGMLKNTKEYE